MSKEVHYCYDDTELSEVAKFMSQKQIRRLPVINKSKKLVGIISLGDLARESRSTQNVGEALQKISQP